MCDYFIGFYFLLGATLCNTTLVYFIYFIYVSSVHKKTFFSLDFWLPVVYLLFNVYIIFYFNYTNSLIGEAYFV